jgi:methylated-DNA-[protein]-cysteine S-methyltransferase
MRRKSNTAVVTIGNVRSEQAMCDGERSAPTTGSTKPPPEATWSTPLFPPPIVNTSPAIVTIVGTGNGWQGITFHTNTKNTPSGQPEEGYTWHMKKTFSDKVRDIVRKIPKSKTMTYKEVASKAGNPKAARAVGAVMRSNYDPSIPCHRVVASDGKMRGYNRGARIR